MDYLVVIEKTKENYSAYGPDLPGCVAAGQTVEEVQQRIREAMAWHLEGLTEDGKPVPPARAQSITIHLDTPAA
jgi:predicted RNase H-like HicB family nuclease